MSVLDKLQSSVLGHRIVPSEMFRPVAIVHRHGRDEFTAAPAAPPPVVPYSDQLAAKGSTELLALGLVLLLHGAPKPTAESIGQGDKLQATKVK